MTLCMERAANMKRNPARNRGFTLMELMITIAIAGILASLALPSFREYILTQKVKSASFDLVAALTLTRSEAIKRNTDVVMAKAAGGWQDGWSVKVGATELRKQDPYSGVSISAGTTASITYSRDGRISAGPVTFIVNDNASNAQVMSRCIRIDLSGRPNSSISSTDGSCP